MNTNQKLITGFKSVFFLLIIASILSLTACQKNNNGGSTPSKFTDLKVNPNFNFDNFVDLNVTINVTQGSQAGIHIIKIYNGNPGTDGKLVKTGATDNSLKYVTTLRVPSSLTELWVADLGPNGNYKYKAVPITGTTLTYTFDGTSIKSRRLKAGPDCSSGCTQTITGNISNLEISSGQQVCIASGTSANISSLTIHNNGKLVVCGSVTLNTTNGWGGGGTITITSTGTLNPTNLTLGYQLKLENYGTVTLNKLTVGQDGSFHNYANANASTSNSFTNGGDFINEGTMTVSGQFTNNGGTVTFNNSGTMTVDNSFDNNSSMTNSGTLTINSGQLTIEGSSSLNNSGPLSVTNKLVNDGTITNSSTLTVNGNFTNNGGSQLTNSCKVIISGNFDQQGTVNNGSYIKVGVDNGGGTTTVNGGAVINMGLNSMMDTKHFNLQGSINGPNTSGCRINILKTTNINWGASVNNYVDLCDADGIEVNHGSMGSHVTYCSYQVTPTDCNPGTGSAPVITSSLSASGTTGQQFIYQITASGNSPITYSATNLPDGLSFSGSTISGNPTSAGTYNVTISATNSFGTDTKTLVITIASAGNAPTITSVLFATGVKGQSFIYTITADGTAPITFNATNLPAGLTFNGSTISGIPSATGVTNVALTATNSIGSDNQTLVITIDNNTSANDSDGDGVADNLDAYPNDPTRAFNSYYPNEVDYGSFVFEDNWPYYGDYDCNDLVVNFQYQIVTNAQNKVVDVVSKFKIKAAGASKDNGFGIVFNTAPTNVQSVTGCIKVGNAVTIDAKGYEAGHTSETVIIPFDAVNTLLGGGMINTSHASGVTVQTALQTVTTHFSNPQDNIGTPPYNPFIFEAQERGKEVHLKDQPPTELVNTSFFGQLPDASNPGQGKYYRSETGLPWAFEIPINFDYPLETVDILQTYLHFAQWAESGGIDYTDWYTDKAGYRNTANIY